MLREPERKLQGDEGMNYVPMTKAEYIKWCIESGRDKPRQSLLNKYQFKPEPEDLSRFDTNEKDWEDFYEGMEVE